MNRFKIHRIVEYIKLSADIPFDTYDVEDDIHGVLHGFGIAEVLDGQEERELYHELMEIAIQEEFTEAARTFIRELQMLQPCESEEEFESTQIPWLLTTVQAPR